MKLKFYMDGDMWCCVDEETFRNIQESPVGFGADQAQAFQNYMVDSGAVLLPATTLTALREALECSDSQELYRDGTVPQKARIVRRWRAHPAWDGSLVRLGRVLRREALALLAGTKRAAATARSEVQYSDGGEWGKGEVERGNRTDHGGDASEQH